MTNNVKKKNEFILHSIGKVSSNEKEMQFSIEINESYRDGLIELDKYTHVHIFWWAQENDNLKSRSNLVEKEFPPFYGKNTPNMGVFATRSPFRPNPIAVTACPIISVDQQNGIIKVPYIDAFDKTPVIDIKPYIPMSDVIEQAKCPPYLEHWPKSYEKAMKWFAEMMEEN